MTAIPIFDPADAAHVAAIRSMLADPWADRAYDLTNVAASLRCSPTREAVLAALDAEVVEEPAREWSE